MSSTSNRLQHLPVTLFASVMGIAGLSLAWRRAAVVWDVSPQIAEVLFWIALADFVMLAVLYISKWVRYPQAALAEVRHPIRIAFVPTITISLLLLATAGQDLLPDAASVAWWIGAVGHLVVTVVVMGAWFERADIGLSQVTPAWFIPVVGNVVTPLAAPELGSTEFGWFAGSIGFMFYLALLPILLLRVLLHGDPLPNKLLPTLAIFLAPPAVSAIAWNSLTGTTGSPVFRLLFSASIAFLALVIAQLPRLVKVPFAMPYWGYTFPLAAVAVVSIAAAGSLPGTAYDVLAVALLALASTMVAAVSVLSLRAAARGEICVPE